MGIYLSTPKTEKFSEDGENDRLRYGLSSMQGWRASMEDAVSYSIQTIFINWLRFLDLRLIQHFYWYCFSMWGLWYICWFWTVYWAWLIILVERYWCYQGNWKNMILSFVLLFEMIQRLIRWIAISGTDVDAINYAFKFVFMFQFIQLILLDWDWSCLVH